MGLGPAETQNGDVICIILGSEVPFLLRLGDNGRYTFAGECYVHGFTDGEAFKELQRRVRDQALSGHFRDFKII